MHELEQLRGLGLTKSLTTQFTDTVKANEEQTQAHLAQLKDLETRKANTKAFEPALNSILSAADAQQLQYSKWKKEDRQKERETMGYYQSYKGDTGGANEKAWKTTGQVLTTMGQANDSTATKKEWVAPQDGTTSVPLGSQPQPQHKEAKTNNAAGTEQAQQGCGCIIL